MTMSCPDRGTVRIKPVYVGIHHYSDLYGSVCSPDVEHTPPIQAPGSEQIRSSARAMVESFEDGTDAEFVELDEPLVIEQHADMRRLASELTHDVDALLVGTAGRRPWEEFTLSQYGLPIIGGPVSVSFLRALRVR